MILPVLLSLILQSPQGPLAPPVRKVDPPRLRIEPAGRVDLGSLGPTQRVSRLYTFRNTSAQPISLRVLDLSPGVTVAGPALQGPIDPGGSADLTLQADPSGFTGWQARNVKLGTDDPKQGEYLLPVGMSIRADLTVDSAKKSFGAVALHESPQLTFSFRRETGEATKLWIASPLPPYLEAEIEPIPAQAATAVPPPEGPGSKGALRLTFRPARLEPGVMAGLESLEVESSAPMQPRFQLYLDWRIKLPVRLSASRLVFLEANEREKLLTIRPGTEGGSLAVRSVRMEGAGFRIPKVLPGAFPQLELRVTRTARQPAKALIVLELEGEPLPVRIPVSYLPPVQGKPAKLELAPQAPAPEAHPHAH